MIHELWWHLLPLERHLACVVPYVEWPSTASLAIVFGANPAPPSLKLSVSKGGMLESWLGIAVLSALRLSSKSCFASNKATRSSFSISSISVWVALSHSSIEIPLEMQSVSSWIEDFAIFAADVHHVILLECPTSSLLS